MIYMDTLQGTKSCTNLVKCFMSIFVKETFVGRIGGDEFVVFMRKNGSREVAVSRIESLIKKVEELSFTEMNGKNITISAGMAFAPEHGTGYLDLYKNADTALYKTKQNGRDGYNIYEEVKKIKDKGERKRLCLLE